MRQILVIFSLTLFTLSSCFGQKFVTKKVTTGIIGELTLNKDFAEFNEPLRTQEIHLFCLKDSEINTGIKVVFGFEWVSFGGPVINFINPKMKAIYINCDHSY